MQINNQVNINSSSDRINTKSNNKEDNPKQPDPKPLQEDQLQITKEQLEKKIEGINKFLTPMETSIKFQLHEKLREYYVQIVDSRTKEVIKEIPSKKFLDMYASMAEFLGLIVDEKI